MEAHREFLAGSMVSAFVPSKPQVVPTRVNNMRKQHAIIALLLLFQQISSPIYAEVLSQSTEHKVIDPNEHIKAPTSKRPDVKEQVKKEYIQPTHEIVHGSPDGYEFKDYSTDFENPHSFKMFRERSYEYSNPTRTFPSIKTSSASKVIRSSFNTEQKSTASPASSTPLQTKPDPIVKNIVVQETLSQKDDIAKSDKTKSDIPNSGIPNSDGPNSDIANNEVSNTSKLEKNSPKRSTKGIVKSSANSLTVRKLYPQWSSQQIDDMPLRAIVLEFSQPMVTVEEVTGKQVLDPPVKLTPSPIGKWQWLDQRTLLYTPEKEDMLFGTKFNISVPKGARSITGTTLTENFSTDITTCLSKPNIYDLHNPSGLAFCFKQPVQRESLIKCVKAEVNSRAVDLRLASDAESETIFKDRYSKNMTFAFLPPEGLPEGAVVSITVLPGIKAENGFAQNSNTMTTGLVINRLGMLLKTDELDYIYEPGEPMLISFDDQIAADNTSDFISITPEISNLDVSYLNNSLVLKGDTKPDTTYQISVRSGFKGKNGKVQSSQSLSLKTSSYLPRLLPPAHSYLLMSPDSTRNYPIMSVNVGKLRVRAYDGDSVQDHWNRYSVVGSKPPDVTPLLDQTFEISSRKNDVVTTNVDISTLINRGYRHFSLFVENAEAAESSSMKSPRKHALDPLTAYSITLQVTNISATCFPVENQLVFYICDVKTGRPISNASVTRFNKWKQEIDSSAPPGWKKHYEEQNNAQDLIATTDMNGLAFLPGAAASAGGSSFLVTSGRDKAIVFAEARGMRNNETPVIVSPDWLNPQQQRASDRKVSITLPFKKSRGVLLCLSREKFAVKPVSFVSNSEELYLPDPGRREDAVLTILKVYEESDENRGSVDLKELSARSRCAITSFYYDLDKEGRFRLTGVPKVRRAAGSIMVAQASQRKTDRGRAQRIDEQSGSADVEFWNSGEKPSMGTPTSIDGLPSPTTCPVVGLDWQVEQLHARWSVSHINKPARRWKPYFPPRTELAQSTGVVQLKTEQMVSNNAKRSEDQSSAQSAPSQEIFKPENIVEVSATNANFLSWRDESSESNLKSLVETTQHQIMTAPVRSILHRASRLMALLESRKLNSGPFLNQKVTEIDRIIREDVLALETVTSSNFDWLGWTPDGERADNHHFEQLVPLIVQEALLKANAEGFPPENRYVLTGLTNYLPELGNCEVKDNTNDFNKLKAYGFYISALMAKIADGDDESRSFQEKRYAEQLETWIKKIGVDHFDGEAISWLTLTSKLIPVTEDCRTQLEARLLRSAKNSLTVPPVSIKLPQPEAQAPVNTDYKGEDKISPAVLDRSTEAALLIVALLDGSDSKNQDQIKVERTKLATELMKAILRDEKSKESKDLTNMSLCLRAICRFAQTQPENDSIFRSNRQRTTSSKGNVKSKHQSTKGSADRMSRTSGSVGSGSLTDYYALQRTFLPADGSSKVWRDSDGNWRCKKGSKILVRLTAIPRNKYDHVVTIFPHPAGFIPVGMPSELTYISMPRWESDWKNSYSEIYNRLPQKIISKKDSLELYSQEVFPMYYTFDYPYEAAKAGRYEVPPVTIECAFNKSYAGRTGGDTIIIEE